MITVYLDESGTHDPNYVVLAGFAGKRRAWEEFVPAWQTGLGKRPFLHLSAMPLKRESERRWLRNLGPLPYEAGLIPVYGAVRPSDYKDLVSGTVAEVHSYGVCLCISSIVEALVEYIPSDERVEFIFEESPIEFYIRRTMLMIVKFPGIQRADGKSRISKWSFMAKDETCLLEPSDYLAHHLYNREIDPESNRSVWTRPILEGHKLLGSTRSQESVRYLYHHLERPEFRKGIPKQEIKDYRKKLRKGLVPDRWNERFGGKP